MRILKIFQLKNYRWDELIKTKEIKTFLFDHKKFVEIYM
jgi:hypothetical protein